MAVSAAAVTAFTSAAAHLLALARVLPFNRFQPTRPLDLIQLECYGMQGAIY